jgi:hypothetical protein
MNIAGTPPNPNQSPVNSIRSVQYKLKLWPEQHADDFEELTQPTSKPARRKATRKK